jgi:hypothetical protein
MRLIIGFACNLHSRDITRIRRSQGVFQELSQGSR